MKEDLTHEELFRIILYSPLTGDFIWRIRKLSDFTHCKYPGRVLKMWATRYSGKLAGNLDKSDGYSKIGIGSTLYKAHRLAVFYMIGNWPIGEVDHNDGDRSNNKWENINDGSKSDNQRNSSKRIDNTSGITGVSWDSRCNSWVARIFVDGKSKYLGSSKILGDAIKSRKDAEKKYGYNKNHGRKNKWQT